MLKTPITAVEYSALNDVLKAEYLLQPEGNYKIDLGPATYVTDKDPAGLLSALENERSESASLRTKIDEFEEVAKKAELEGATKVTEIKEIYKRQNEELQAKFDAERTADKQRRLTNMKAQAELDAKTKVQELASTLFGDNAALTLPHIESLVTVAVDEDSEAVSLQFLDPVTRQPQTSQTFENFQSTVSTIPTLKPMLVASRASGGSANEGSGKSSVKATKEDGTIKSYYDYDPSELVDIKAKDPELYSRLRKQEFGD